MKYPFVISNSLILEKDQSSVLIYVADSFLPCLWEAPVREFLVLKCAGTGYQWPCHITMETVGLRICELPRVLTCQIWQWFLTYQSSFRVVDKYSVTSELGELIEHGNFRGS